MGLDHKNKPVWAAPTLPTGFSDIVISNKARNSLAVIVCMSAHKNNLHKSNVQCSISVRTGKRIPGNVTVSHHINRHNQGLWYIMLSFNKSTVRLPFRSFLTRLQKTTPSLFPTHLQPEYRWIANRIKALLQMGILIDHSGPHYTINNHLHQIIATPKVRIASASLSKNSGCLSEFIFFMSEKKQKHPPEVSHSTPRCVLQDVVAITHQAKALGEQVNHHWYPQRILKQTLARETYLQSNDYL